MRQFSILFSIASLILAGLACVGERRFAPLRLNQPINFSFLGETDHIWQLDVLSNTQYEILLSTVDTRVRLSKESVDVTVKSGGKFLEMHQVVESQQVVIRFEAQTTGTVFINVSSLVGENQNEIGDLTIAVKQR